MRHEDYLMKNKRVLFNIMLTKGTLYQCLVEVDKQAEEMFYQLIDDMAKSEGITDQLKARAREIVNTELIYR